MSIDDIMVRLIEEVFPSAAQFMMVLIALMGVVIAFMACTDLYRMISEDQNRTADGATVSGTLTRFVIGGLMVVPSAVLWRAADVFIGESTVTETNILAYMSATPTETCERFGAAINLMFLVVGLFAFYFAYRNADDKARGFNREGLRTAVPYAIGGLACIFIEDIFSILSEQFGFDAGLSNLCSAFG